MGDIKLGCHVGMAGKDMFLASARKQLHMARMCLCSDTGAPQKTREERKSLSST